MDRNEVLELVVGSLREVVETEEEAPPLNGVGEETALLGDGAVVDSMGLVSLVVLVEQRLSITIANERAMSMTRSPFRTIGTLVDYVLLLLEEQSR
jgi:acyl carrier protein